MSPQITFNGSIDFQTICLALIDFQELQGLCQMEQGKRPPRTAHMPRNPMFYDQWQLVTCRCHLI